MSVTSIIGQYLQARLEPTQVERLTGNPFEGSLLAYLTNVSLRWNALAYYEMASIMFI
jgi:hypothetical protein